MCSERCSDSRTMKSTGEPAAAIPMPGVPAAPRDGAGAHVKGHRAPAWAEAFREEDETLEPLLRDCGWILQKRRGFRFSLDALLLSWLVAVRQGPARGRTRIRYMDLCTGSGIVPILLARWHPGLKGFGVEIQQPLASMARRNMRLHGLESRMEILCENLKDLPRRFPKGSVDWITINPPYRKLRSGRVNPDPQKAVARHELAATLREICSVMGFLLRHKGKAFLVYPAARLAELLAELQGAGLAPKVLRPVYPRPGQNACWVLVEAVCGVGDGLQVDEPLYIEKEQGGDSEEVARIFLWRF